MSPLFLKLKPVVEPDPDQVPVVAVCPHDLEEGEDHCEICAPVMEIRPGRCEEEFCIAAKDELPDPHVKFVTLARSCDTDQEYVNVHHMHFGEPYKIHKVLKGNPDGSVRLTFWADNLGEWLQCDAPQHYRLTTAPEYLARAARPQVESPEARRRRASHLAPFRKARAELTPEPAQPTRCIVGQIGAEKVLVDAGDGTVIAKFMLASGVIFDPKVEAAKLGRTLVGQKDATQYAMMTLRRAWADAKAKK